MPERTDKETIDVLRAAWKMVRDEYRLKCKVWSDLQVDQCPICVLNDLVGAQSATVRTLRSGQTDEPHSQVKK